MKKICRVLLCLIAMLSISGCGKTKKLSDTKADHKALYEQGLVVVNLINENVHSEEYITMMGVPSDILDSDIFKKISACDYTAPDNIYSVVFPDNVIDILGAFESNGTDLSKLSPEMKENVNNRIFTNYATFLTSTESGAMATATVSLFNGTHLFTDTVNPETKLMCIYCYKDSYPIAVTFVHGEDGATLASGSFIIVDNFAFEDEAAVKDSISGIYSGFVLDPFADIEVTKIK